MVKTKVWLINPNSSRSPMPNSWHGRSLCMHLWNTSWGTGASHGVDDCPMLWIQWLWDILGKLSTHFVDLILMHSQSVSLGLLQFHICSKKLALWEWRTVKKTSMVGIKAWCVHRCCINFKIWYVFLGITLFSLTYPFFGGRWGGGHARRLKIFYWPGDIFKISGPPWLSLLLYKCFVLAIMMCISAQQFQHPLRPAHTFFNQGQLCHISLVTQHKTS